MIVVDKIIISITFGCCEECGSDSNHAYDDDDNSDDDNGAVDDDDIDYGNDSTLFDHQNSCNI